MYAMYCKQFAIVAYPFDGISFHIIKYSTSFLYSSLLSLCQSKHFLS